MLLNYIYNQFVINNKTNMSKLTNRSNFLPNITSTPSLSYTQRYEHMTKLANYNELNEGQIWK